jgi:uncharacterized damage-inducible protein DinB
MSNTVGSIRAEFLRYKTLAEKALAQVSDAELSASTGDAASSLATICWHISGNLTSRFTDFLTEDGEKPWRHRDEEFEARAVTHAELDAKWAMGWTALMRTLDALGDDDLDKTVLIRGQQLSVTEALHRALAHTSYHVGQIVYVAKALRGKTWSYLSIPPGQSDEYNRKGR